MPFWARPVPSRYIQHAIKIKAPKSKLQPVNSLLAGKVEHSGACQKLNVTRILTANSPNVGLNNGLYRPKVGIRNGKQVQKWLMNEQPNLIKDMTNIDFTSSCV